MEMVLNFDGLNVNLLEDTVISSLIDNKSNNGSAGGNGNPILAEKEEPLNERQQREIDSLKVKERALLFSLFFFF